MINVFVWSTRRLSLSGDSGGGCLPLMESMRASELIPHVHSTLETFQSALQESTAMGSSTVEYEGTLEDLLEMLAVTIQHSFESGETQRIEEQLHLHDHVTSLLEKARNPRVRSELSRGERGAKADVRAGGDLWSTEEASSPPKEDQPMLRYTPPHSPKARNFTEGNVPAEGFPCSICYEDVEATDGYRFESCNHEFCKEVRALSWEAAGLNGPS